MFTSGKMESMFFSLFSPLITTKKLRHYIQNKHKTLKGRMEKEDWLGTSGHEEWHGGEFLGFSFCLIYPRLEVEEASNLKTPMKVDKKRPTKACSL